MNRHPLDYVFQPHSVAVVGASPGPGRVGFLAPIQEMGFSGPLYPVNPRYEEVGGLKCYPSLRDIPTDVDHVISSIPAAAVPRLIEDCGAKNVRVIHFFTAGFRETGEEDRVELQEAIIERARALGIRVIGPNCMGLYVPESGLSFSPGMPRESGDVGFVSQSGGNAIEFVTGAAARGLRFSKAVSYGNAADLCEADFFDYLADDPDTRIVTSYLEGVTDGRRFATALKKCGSRKPVVILKGGRTEAGGGVTLSHTASLAGPIRIFDALCRQAGVIRVEGMDELIDMATTFKRVKRVRGRNACLIITGGGGRSVLAADDTAGEGLDVPQLPPESQDRLREFTPIPGTIIRNPIDQAVMGMGRTMPGQGEDDPSLRTLTIAAESPNIDMLIYASGVSWQRRAAAEPTPAGPAPAEMARRQVENLAVVQAKVGKPVVLVIDPPTTTEGLTGHAAFMDAANNAGIAVFPSVRRAALALSRLLQWQGMNEDRSNT